LEGSLGWKRKGFYYYGYQPKVYSFDKETILIHGINSILMGLFLTQVKPHPLIMSFVQNYPTYLPK
jgi:hypothetical protein